MVDSEKQKAESRKWKGGAGRQRVEGWKRVGNPRSAERVGMREEEGWRLKVGRGSKGHRGRKDVYRFLPIFTGLVERESSMWAVLRSAFTMRRISKRIN